MASVVVMNTGYHILLSAPYHPALPDRCRELKGVFNREEKTWEFDLSHEIQVRRICFDIFGTDGSDEVPLVMVHARLDLLCGRQDAEVWCCGRMLAGRFDKNKPPRLGPGVVLLDGGFSESGGTGRKLRLNPHADTLVEVSDVPLSLAQIETDKGMAVTIVTEDDGLRQALIDEKERLLNRVREIEEQLLQLNDVGR
jgi:hypothetical protein